MTIYSIVPDELIFESIDVDPNQTREVRYNGIMMEVLPVNLFQAQIIRIISPDPSVFLNPVYRPGEMIDMVPRH